MDYFFGDGVGEPTQWQDEPDLTLGTGGADALRLDFDGDGYLDDALWDSDLDGVADRVVTDVGAGAQAVYADEAGRGVWNVAAGGAGALVAGSVAGSVGGAGDGPVGPGSSGAGSYAAGSLGAGSVGAGSIGAGSIGAGSIGAGSVAAGSALVGAAGAGEWVSDAVPAGSAELGPLPDWGALLADAVGALEAGSADIAAGVHGAVGSESARWTTPPVVEPAPAAPGPDPVGQAPQPVPGTPPVPGTQPAPAAPPMPDTPPAPAAGPPVQGGTLPEPPPPEIGADGSLRVDTGSGLLAVTDSDGDGHLDAALPIDPATIGSMDAGALGPGSAAAGSAAAGSAAAGAAAGSAGAGSVAGGSIGGGSVGGGSVAGGSMVAGWLGAGS